MINFLQKTTKPLLSGGFSICSVKVRYFRYAKNRWCQRWDLNRTFWVRFIKYEKARYVRAFADHTSYLFRVVKVGLITFVIKW